MLFLDTFALFLTTQDSGGLLNSHHFPLPKLKVWICASQTKDIMKNKTLQLAHREPYVVQTTQRAEKLFAEFCDKPIKFAEQIYFPWPNLGESSQGKQYSCLDYHQCIKDEEPGVFQTLDLI